jgi:hypothetical protein
MAIQSQPGQIVCETLSQKTHDKKGIGRVAQGLGPEFKLPTTAKNEKRQEKERKK